MKIYTHYYKRRKKRSWKTKVIVYSIFSFLLVIGIQTFLVRTKPTIVSPIIDAPKNVLAIKKTALSFKTKEELQQRVEKQLNTSIPEYSIIIDDFLRPVHVEIGDQIPFEGASVHKIYILFSIAKQIQAGSLTWDKTITFEERDRQDYGTGSIRYLPAGKQFTIKRLCELMMIESDNTAAYILARRILTFEKIQHQITEWGLQSTTMEENMTTNTDMNMLLRKFFTGQLFPSVLTRELMDMMDDSIYEDRIPALLPKQVKVYHKIGTAIAGLHDVGIVVTPESFYYIGVFTKGVSDEPKATETIANISKAVFDYMQE